MLESFLKFRIFLQGEGVLYNLINKGVIEMSGLTLKPVMLSEAKHLGGRPKGAKSNISVDALGVSLSFSGINTLFIKGVC